MERILNLRTLALTVIVAALVGCAAPQISMSTQAQSNIEQIEGVLTIPQSSLDVTVQATNPGNSGLLGALIFSAIDSSRKSSAEESAVPMLATLRDYDFREVMLKASTDAFSKIQNVKVALPLQLDKIGSESSSRITLDQSTASAVLFCHIGYRYESDALIVTANAVMYPKAASLQQYRKSPSESNPLADGNVIYRKTFTYTRQNVSSNTMKDSLNQAAISLSKQIAADINHGR